MTTTLRTHLSTLTPFAGGGFSDLYLVNGKVVKLLEDGCYSDTVVECHHQKIAADSGLAPQIHSVSQASDDTLVVMDLVPSDMVNLGSGDDCIPTLLGELPFNQAVEGFVLYCKLLVAGLVLSLIHI